MFLLLVFSLSSGIYAQAEKSKIKPVPAAEISRADDAFLEGLSRRTSQFLWDHSDPKTGLKLDRTLTDGTPKVTNEGQKMASSAATGFALTGFCIAADRK